MEKKTERPPDKVFHCGPVQAVIWLNNVEKDNEVVAIHSIRIQKIYKDKNDNEWKHTYSFNVEDLPKIALMATEVYREIRVRAQVPEMQGRESKNVGPEDCQDNQPLTG